MGKKVKFECTHHKIAYVSMKNKKGVLRRITRGNFLIGFPAVKENLTISL